jgi:hypothetical protein
MPSEKRSLHAAAKISAKLFCLQQIHKSRLGSGAQFSAAIQKRLLNFYHKELQAYAQLFKFILKSDWPPAAPLLKQSSAIFRQHYF